MFSSFNWFYLLSFCCEFYLSSSFSFFDIKNEANHLVFCFSVRNRPPFDYYCDLWPILISNIYQFKTMNQRSVSIFLSNLIVHPIQTDESTIQIQWKINDPKLNGENWKTFKSLNVRVLFFFCFSIFLYYTSGLIRISYTPTAVWFPAYFRIGKK